LPKYIRLVFSATLVFGHLSFAAFAQQGHRQLGSHQHGHGQFNVVMEGRKVVMELNIPGRDVTGFEHKPSTPAQMSVLKKVTVRLKSGLTLFVPPAAAQCKLVAANVETSKEEHHDDADDDKDGGHMEFHVQYRLECSAPQKFDRIRFDFFKAYPSTQALEVMIISDKGQRVYDITAANPVADMPVQ